MKHIVILAFVCLSYFFAQAQNVPQGIAYQAVAIKDGAYSVAGQNPQAIYWSNKDIKVRFTIFEKYPNGSAQYSELHEITTDDYGVFNVIIGQGMAMSGDFESIPWELGTAHLQVEIDFESTNTFTLTSMERFWSVPYAFVTNQTDGSNLDSALDDLNNKYDYLKNRDKDTVIGNEGVSYQTLDSINKALQAQIAALKFSDKDTVVGNELQTLSLAQDSLEISDGNMIVIKHPENLDNDSTNELQSISLANDTISLSNGGGSVTLSEIKTYVENNTSFSSSNNVYDNGACFEGVLVDLNEWAFANGASVPSFLGEIADSVVVFRCRISSQWKVFIHDIKRDTIISSTVSSSGQTSHFCGDSVVYTSTKGSVILYKIDSDLNASVIATFSGGPPSYSAIVNESKDLIWIDASDDLKKYDYAAKTIYTYSNTQSGGYNLLHQLVAHDTILLGNRLMDSKKMTVLQTFPFLDGLAQGTVIYWNGEIYYVSSTNGFRVYNISTTQDFRLGSGGTGLELYGTNNGELWLGYSISSTSSGGIFMNQYLPPGATSLLTMNKAGVVQYRGVGKTTSLRRLPSNKKISLRYAPGQGIDGLCLNGMWTRGIGYFYSR